jgi:hypothetical protein
MEYNVSLSLSLRSDGHTQRRHLSVHYTEETLSLCANTGNIIFNLKGFPLVTKLGAISFSSAVMRIAA